MGLGWEGWGWDGGVGVIGKFALFPPKHPHSGSRPPTESCLDVDEADLLSRVRGHNAILFADGNRAWKRAAMESGIEFHDVKHALLAFSRTVRTRAGYVVKAGTQVLDRQWRSLKDYLPKTLATKSKAGHVNQSLWQWTYSWQYRYNNGKDLWTAVPHVLKHIRNA